MVELSRSQPSRTSSLGRTQNFLGIFRTYRATGRHRSNWWGKARASTLHRRERSGITDAASARHGPAKAVRGKSAVTFCGVCTWRRERAERLQIQDQGSAETNTGARSDPPNGGFGIDRHTRARVRRVKANDVSRFGSVARGWNWASAESSHKDLYGHV